MKKHDFVRLRLENGPLLSGGAFWIRVKINIYRIKEGKCRDPKSVLLYCIQSYSVYRTNNLFAFVIQTKDASSVTLLVQTNDYYCFRIIF